MGAFRNESRWEWNGKMGGHVEGKTLKVTEERFQKGYRFSEYLHEIRKHEGLWNGLYEHTEIPQDAIDRLRDLPGRRRVLVLAEDWCGDAASLVPILVKMAEAAPEKVELRIFKRDENLDIMDRHLTHGGRSIPLAIVYDAEMGELGSWGPRPAPAQAIFHGRILALEAGELDDRAADVYRPILKWYREDRGRHTIDEMLMVLERDGALRT